MNRPPAAVSDDDEAAFAEALGAVSRPAYLLARRLSRTADDAFDAVQDAALKAWRYRRTRKGPFQSWFLSIVYREAVRTRKRWLTAPLFWSAKSGEWPQESPLLADEIGGYISDLPRRQQIALWLHLGMDLPLAQVGQVMGISERAAIQLLWRARTSLRARVGAGGKHSV